jgi:lipopolysaccharide transport system permease protein
MWLGESGPRALLWLPVWALIQIAMAYFLALGLAVLTAALRDIGNLVQTLFGMLIFFAPILFPLERVPEAVRPLLWLNPFTALANGYHSILLRGDIPAWPDLLGALAWLLLLMVAASILLRRSREQLVDWL